VEVKVNCDTEQLYETNVAAADGACDVVVGILLLHQQKRPTYAVGHKKTLQNTFVHNFSKC